VPDLAYFDALYLAYSDVPNLAYSDVPNLAYSANIIKINILRRKKTSFLMPVIFVPRDNRLVETGYAPKY